MSKSLLNLLVQISKALVYSKNQILFRKEFSFTFGPIGPVANRPSRGPLFFLTSPPPLPTGPQPLGRPSRLARRWRLTRLPPSSRGSASSRAASALSSRPANRWTRPIIPHLWPAGARSCRHHLLPLLALPSSTSDAA
jgi:hypothetical protein